MGPSWYKHKVAKRLMRWRTQVSASASGFYCKTNLCGTANHQTMTMAPTPFHSSAKMLQIKAPTFETATVAQSSTDPEQ